MRLFFKQILLNLILIAFLGKLSFAYSTEQSTTIDIPPSNLVEALNTLAKQTNRALIYPYRLASTFEVGGLYGEYSAQQALEIILEGTGLKGEIRSSGIIRIFKIKPKIEEPTGPEPSLVQSPVTEPENEVEVIVVEGQLFAVDQSTNFKRYSDSQSEQIDQAQINKIANRDAADIVRNVASISTNKVYGGGTHISVRGFGPEFNNVLYNGRVIATENQGREFSFDVLSSNVIDTVNVYKSPSTDIIAGSIGATINLVSPKPGNHLGFHSKSSFKLGYSDLSGQYFPEFSQLVSYNDGDFGALMSFHYHDKDYRLESINTDGWIPVDLSYLEQGDQDYARVYVPRNYDMRIDEGTESRVGGNLVLQGNVSDRTLLTADLLFSKYEVDSNIMSSGNWTHVNPIGVESVLNESFQSVDVNDQNTLLGYRYREDKDFATDFVELNRNRPTETVQLGFNIQHILHDSLDLIIDTSFSAAENNNGGKQQFIIAGVPFANPVYQFEPGADYASLTYDRSFGVEDIRSHGTIFNGEDVKDQIFQTRIDLNWFPDSELFTQFDTGIYYSNRNKERIGYHSPNGWEFAGYAFDIPDELFTPFDAGEFLDGDFQQSWYSFDALQYVDFLWSDQHIQEQIIDTEHPLADSIWIIKQTGGVKPVYFPSMSWLVNEKLTEAYVSMKFAGETSLGLLTGNFGVRYANTKVESSGTTQSIRNIETIEGDPTNLILNYSSAHDIREVNEYNNLLPSLNLKLTMSEQSLLSLGLSKTMTRPTLSDLSITLGSYIPRVGASVAFQGDPNLKPTESNNVDLNFSYYWNPFSVVEIAYFHKEFRNYLTSKSELRQLHDSQYGEFLVISPHNIDNERVDGWELNLVSQFKQLPGAFSGIGARLIYTDVVTSKSVHENSGSAIPALEGASDSHTAVLFYDFGNINFNLSLFHRDSFLQTRTGKLGEVVMVAARNQLDFGLNYKWRNIQLSLQALNITNEPYKSYSVYEERLISYVNTGRDLSLSMSYEF